jgi:hydroxymethylglutaryl-CoA lyase
MMSNNRLPTTANIFEVGPRDGLQNETELLAVSDKVALINRLSKSGLKNIEAGSFVSPKWVPQMASSDKVLQQIDRVHGITYSALTPNLQGLDAAIESGVDEIAVFAAASEGFSQKNINCSIEQSLARFADLIEKAQRYNIPVRGYVSCVIACPYDGVISPQQVAKVSQQLINLGCYQISLGDTIGVGTANTVSAMIEAVKVNVDVDKLAIHCHDTYGQAIANIVAALEAGISTIDSSVAGLGGCPYAKGASGNVATEDVLYLLQGLGIKTGVDLQSIVDTGNFISARLNRANQSKAANALSN